MPKLDAPENLHAGFNTPEARAERLKRIRNLANLTRKEMCEFEGLNINTYKGWEIARYGGLTLDGAKLVIQRVKNAGVVCSFEWLWNGSGVGPSVNPTISSSTYFIDDVQIPNSDLPTRIIYIEKEISLFQNFYHSSVVHQITEDCLHPYYEQGDYVCGIRVTGQDIAQLNGKLCIVETVDHQRYARLLKRGHDENHFNLLATNINSKTLYPIITAELLYAAAISRLYKVNL